MTHVYMHSYCVLDNTEINKKQVLWMHIYMSHVTYVNESCLILCVG